MAVNLREGTGLYGSSDVREIDWMIVILRKHLCEEFRFGCFGVAFCDDAAGACRNISDYRYVLINQGMNVFDTCAGSRG